MMMKIEHENILKILDIHYSQFSKDFIGFISHSQPVYKDRIMEEDIYSVEGLREDHEVVSEQVENELIQITELSRKHDCGYFRIIYT